MPKKRSTSFRTLSKVLPQRVSSPFGGYFVGAIGMAHCTFSNKANSRWAEGIFVLVCQQTRTLVVVGVKFALY